jgi:mannosyltransferase OCH1-like enzyme
MVAFIHRIWLGPDVMPDGYVENGKRWAELNPGWTVKDWTEDDLPFLINQRIYDQLGDGAIAPIPLKPDVAIAVQRADVVSYELLHQFGGVYVNTDIEPLRPVDYLSDIVKNDAWAAYEDANFLNNAAMGARYSRHRFWAAVIAELPKRFDRMVGQPMNKTTGPHLLTDVYHNYGNDDFVALPRESFHYAHFSDVPLGGNANHLREAAMEAGAIGLHNWGHRGMQI